jgi:hypothetical protein
LKWHEVIASGKDNPSNIYICGCCHGEHKSDADNIPTATCFIGQRIRFYEASAEVPIQQDFLLASIVDS